MFQAITGFIKKSTQSPQRAGSAAFVHANNFYKSHTINFRRFAEAGATTKMRKIFQGTMVIRSTKNGTADERGLDAWCAHPPLYTAAPSGDAGAQSPQSSG